MIEIVSRSLGFVSASLVALFALGFGTMFLFFSGSAALILGHFLRFVRPARVALPFILLSTLASAALAIALDAPSPLAPPAGQLATALLAWGLVRARALHRALTWLLGAVLLVCGALFALGLVSPDWGDTGQAAISIAASLFLLGALGVWPLVIAGDAPVAVRLAAARQLHAGASIRRVRRLRRRVGPARRAVHEGARHRFLVVARAHARRAYESLGADLTPLRAGRLPAEEHRRTG